MLWIRRCFGGPVETEAQRNSDRAAHYKVGSDHGLFERSNNALLDYATFLRRFQSPAAQVRGPHASFPAASCGTSAVSVPSAASQHSPVIHNERRLAVACVVRAAKDGGAKRQRRSLALIEDGEGAPRPQLTLQVIWAARCAKPLAEPGTAPPGPSSPLSAPGVSAAGGLDTESYQGLLEGLSKRDEAFTAALRQVARASYDGTYCSVKHKPHPQPGSGLVQPLQGVTSIELSACRLMLGTGGHTAPGLLVVVHWSAPSTTGAAGGGVGRRLSAVTSASPHSPRAASFAAGGGSVGSVRSLVGVGFGSKVVTLELASLDSAAAADVAEPAAQQSQAHLQQQGQRLGGSGGLSGVPRTPSWSPAAVAAAAPRSSAAAGLRMPSLTAKMRLAAAARAVAAEVLPASVMVFTYSRGNTLAEVAYLNSRAREYLCLGVTVPLDSHFGGSQVGGPGLQALPARALLAAILQHGPPNVVRQLHQAAASAQGFCATFKVPAFIDAAALVQAAAGGGGGRTCTDGNDGGSGNGNENAYDEDDGVGITTDGGRLTPLHTISDISEDAEAAGLGRGQGRGQGQGQGQQGDTQTEAAKLGLVGRGPSQQTVRDGSIGSRRLRSYAGMSSFRPAGRRSSIAVAAAPGAQVVGRAVSMRPQTAGAAAAVARYRSAAAASSVTSTSRRSTDHRTDDVYRSEFPQECLVPELRMLSRAVLSVHGDMLWPQSASLARSVRGGAVGVGNRGSGAAGSGGGSLSTAASVVPGGISQASPRVSPGSSWPRLQWPQWPMELAGAGHALDAAEQELLQRLMEPSCVSGPLTSRQLAKLPPTAAAASAASTCTDGGATAAPTSRALTLPYQVSARIASGLHGSSSLGSPASASAGCGEGGIASICAGAALEGHSQLLPSLHGGGGIGRVKKKMGVRRVATLASGHLQQRVAQAEMESRPVAAMAMAMTTAAKAAAAAAVAGGGIPQRSPPAFGAMSSPAQSACSVGGEGGGGDGLRPRQAPGSRRVVRSAMGVEFTSTMPQMAESEAAEKANVAEGPSFGGLQDSGGASSAGAAAATAFGRAVAATGLPAPAGVVQAASKARDMSAPAAAAAMGSDSAGFSGEGSGCDSSGGVGEAPGGTERHGSASQDVSVVGLVLSESMDAAGTGPARPGSPSASTSPLASPWLSSSQFATAAVAAARATPAAGKRSRQPRPAGRAASAMAWPPGAEGPPDLPSSAPAPTRIDLLMRAYRTVDAAAVPPPQPPGRSRFCRSSAGVAPPTPTRGSALGAAAPAGAAAAVWRGGSGSGMVSTARLAPRVDLRRAATGLELSDGVPPAGGPPYGRGGGDRRDENPRELDQQSSAWAGGRKIAHSREDNGHGSSGITGSGGAGGGGSGLAPGAHSSSGAGIPTPLHRIVLMQQRMPSKSRMSFEQVRDAGGGGGGGGGSSSIPTTAAASASGPTAALVDVSSSGAGISSGTHASQAAAAAAAMAGSRRRSIASPAAAAATPLPRLGLGLAVIASAAGVTAAEAASPAGSVSAGLLTSGGNSTSYGAGTLGSGAVGSGAMASGGYGGVGPSTLHMSLRDSGLARWDSGASGGGVAVSGTWDRSVSQNMAGATAMQPLAIGSATAVSAATGGSPSSSGCWMAAAPGSLPAAAGSARLSVVQAATPPARTNRRGNSIRARVHALLDQAELAELQRAGSGHAVSGTTFSHSLGPASMRPGSSITGFGSVLRAPSSGAWPSGWPASFAAAGAVEMLTQAPRTGAGGAGADPAASVSCRLASSRFLQRDSLHVLPYDVLLTANASGGASGDGCSGGPASGRFPHRHHTPTDPASLEACIGGCSNGGGGDRHRPFLSDSMSRQESAILQIIASVDDSQSAAAAAAKGDATGGGGVALCGRRGAVAAASGVMVRFGASSGVMGLMASGGSVYGASAAAAAAGGGGSDDVPAAAADGSSRNGDGGGTPSRGGPAGKSIEVRILSPAQLDAVSPAVQLHANGAKEVSPEPLAAPLSMASRNNTAYDVANSFVDGRIGDLASAIMGNTMDHTTTFEMDEQQCTLIPRSAAAAPGAAPVGMYIPEAGPSCESPGRSGAAAGGGSGGLVGLGPQEIQKGSVSGISSAAATAALPVAAMAWCQLRARTCTTVDGRRVLMLIMSDVTKQIQTQERVASLVEQEHRILEALFPRHVIAYLTAPSATDGEDGGGGGTASVATTLAGSSGRGIGCHSLRRRRLAAGGSRRGGSAMGEADEGRRSQSESMGRGRSQLRQLALQHHHNTAKVSRLATEHNMVTILFSDIVGFTAFSRQVPPLTVMRFLNELYQRLDALLDIYKVYKVETIGDCYVVAGGLVRYDEDGLCTVLPEGETDELHAVRVMEFAKAMLRASREVTLPTTGEPVQVRLGLHSGPAMSGVVGSKMPRFTVFGETVEAAHRMESSGRPGRIHVSGVTRALLRSEAWEATEGVQIEGRGRIDTYLWLEEADDDAAAKQRVMAVYL